MAEGRDIDAEEYARLVKDASSRGMSTIRLNQLLTEQGYTPVLPQETDGKAEWAAQHPYRDFIERAGKATQGAVFGALGAADKAIESVPTLYDTFGSDPNITPLRRWLGAINAPGTGAETVARLGRKAVEGYGATSDFAESQMLAPTPAFGLPREAYEQVYNAANIGKAGSELLLPTTKLSAMMLPLMGKNPKATPDGFMEKLGPQESVYSEAAGPLGRIVNTPGQRANSPFLQGLEEWLGRNSAVGSERGVAKTQAENLLYKEQAAAKGAEKTAKGAEESLGALMAGETEAEHLAAKNAGEQTAYKLEEKLRKQAAMLEAEKEVAKYSKLKSSFSEQQKEANKIANDYNALPPEYKQGLGKPNAAAQETGATLQREFTPHIPDPNVEWNTATVLKQRTQEAWSKFHNSDAMPASWHSVDPKLVDDLSKMADNIEARGLTKGGKFTAPQPADAEAYKAIQSVLNGNGTFSQLRGIVEELPKGTPLESRITSTFAEKAANSAIPEVRAMGESYLSAVNANMEQTALTGSMKKLVARGASPNEAIKPIMNGAETDALKDVMGSSVIPKATKDTFTSAAVSKLSDVVDDAVRAGTDPEVALRKALDNMGQNADIILDAKGQEFLHEHAKNLKVAQLLETRFPEVTTELKKTADEIASLLKERDLRLKKLTVGNVERARLRGNADKAARTKIDKLHQDALAEADRIKEQTRKEVEALMAAQEEKFPTKLAKMGERPGEKGTKILQPRRTTDVANLATKGILGAGGVLALAMGQPMTAAKIVGFYVSLRLASRIPGGLARAYYNPVFTPLVTTPARLGKQGIANISYAALQGEREAERRPAASAEQEKKTGWEALYKSK